MALFLIKAMLLLWHYLFSPCFYSSQLKEINTTFFCGVSDDGTILKVPFFFYQVTGSLFGEALSEKLLMEMSRIRDLKRKKKSTYDRTEDTLKNYKKMHNEKNPEDKYHLLYVDLRVNIKLYK